MPRRWNCSTLLAHPLGRHLAAAGANFGARRRLLLFPKLLGDQHFNRQTVVVPAGDVGALVALHGPKSRRHVLQDFVEGVADVDVAVGEGRAVVQDKRPARRGLPQGLGVDVVGAPEVQHLWLALGQVGALRDGGRVGVHPVRIFHVRLGDIQGLAIVGLVAFRLGDGVSHGVPLGSWGGGASGQPVSRGGSQSCGAGRPSTGRSPAPVPSPGSEFVLA